MSHIVSQYRRIGVAKPFLSSPMQEQLVEMAVTDFGFLLSSTSRKAVTFAEFAEEIAKHYDSENPRTKAVITALKEVSAINPAPLAGYPLAIVRKYQTILAASGGQDFNYHYVGPKVQVEVSGLGVQHFAVFKVGVSEPVVEFKSPEGNMAWTQAILHAESLGLPWRSEGAANFFDPDSCRCWSYHVM